jgi:hypothetical protein
MTAGASRATRSTDRADDHEGLRRRNADDPSEVVALIEWAASRRA